MLRASLNIIPVRKNMFWKKCRKKYHQITANDEAIQKYLRIMSELQGEGYRSIHGYLQDLGHKFVSKQMVQGRTLEIGFGRGRQAMFYRGHEDDYYPTDINQQYVVPEIWGRFKNAQIVDASCLPFEDHYFDQVVSVYNLEHVADPERVLLEVKRVLKTTGKFVVALPCEGGFAWNLGRELFMRRAYQKRFGIDYDKVIAFEHKHCLKELLLSLDKHFTCVSSRYYPCGIPWIDINFIYCGIYEHD